MSDYISRQTVLRCIKESRDGIDWGQSEDGDAFLHYSAALYRTIDSEECVPAADVVPVRHGTWLPIVSYNNTYKCSECGRLLVNIADGLKMVVKHYPYCHCGAKMDGGKNT